MTTSGRRSSDPSTALIYRTSLLVDVANGKSDGKIPGRIVDPGVEPRVRDYMWPKE